MLRERDLNTVRLPRGRRDWSVSLHKNSDMI